MPDSTEAHLQAADRAVTFARDVRRYHARRTPKTSNQRKTDLAEARERLRAAMKPLRSYLGRPDTRNTAASIRERERVFAASQAIQTERRKVWKMQQRAAPREEVTA